MVVPSPPPTSSIEIAITLDGTEVGNSGALSVTGWAEVESAISADGAGGDWTLGPGNGSFAYIDSQFYIEDVTFIVDLGIVQLTAELEAVGLKIVSSGGSNGGTGIPVLNNTWDLDTIGSPDSLDITLNTGKIYISGAINEELDLDASPVGVNLTDLAGLGINGLADNNSVANFIPNIAVDVGEDILGPDLLFAELGGEIYVHVPEPSTLLIAGIGLVGLVPLARRRPRSSA